MTIRLNCGTESTERLLTEVLRHLNQDERVMFLTDAGCGAKVEQRLRVKLSRIRQKLIEQGRMRKHFRLSCSIHPHTEGGLRYDCVVMWRFQNETHKAIEMLEDLVGHGQSI